MIRGEKGMRIKYILAIIIALLLSYSSFAHAGEIIKGHVTTSDNIPISYDHYKNGFDTVIIVCPGYYNSKENRWMEKTAEILSSEHDTIVFDFRGHGESGGEFTWAALEHRDVNAIIDYAKSEGYKKIGILGYSLGGSATINAVSGREEDVDAMVLISAPKDFKDVEFHFWELGVFDDFFDNIFSGWDGKGAKTTDKFKPETTPIEEIKKIKNTPKLFIHGEDDWVVKPHHSEELFNAANEPKKLVIIKISGHAEMLINKRPEEMKELLLGWFGDNLKNN